MKSNAFREQVAMLISWFKTWSDCEQTVAIYSLLKRSSPVQAKFLQQVLQHVLTDCNDIKELEEKANDEEYVRSLRSKEKSVLHQLLQLFPLLKVGENSAKAAYLELIPDHLSHTILNGVNVEESRQLISFSLIHPALSPEERGPLHNWLGYLDERLTYGNNYQSFGANISSSNNRLTVGSGSSSSSSSSGGSSNNPSHSPSPVSPSHRSVSQSSLCQDSSSGQDCNNTTVFQTPHHPSNPNMLSPHILPKQNHSSLSQPSSPTINIWQQQQQQQPPIPNDQTLQGGVPSGMVDAAGNVPNGQNFNFSGNFNNNNNKNLAVGQGSGGNNLCYSPSAISSGQRSISQTSLCQDSTEQTQINLSGMRPLSGHSPNPSVLQWQQQQQQSNQQQMFQHSFQGNETQALEPSPGHGSLSGSHSDISRFSGQYNTNTSSSGNSHRMLRASNSHNVATFEAPRRHTPLKAVASAPPNFNSSQTSSSKYQDKFSYSSSSGQRSHARLSRTRSIVPPSRWQREQQQQQHQPLAQSSSTPGSGGGSSASLWWRQNPHKGGSSGGGTGGHAPLSPQSSVTSSESSDSHHEDGPPSNDDFQEGPSRDVLLWLKEIRLHKYAILFRDITHEELPNLSEEWLLQNNVVRGARQRFMINIEKLRERQTLLRQLEKDIKKDDDSMDQVLRDLKSVLQTPIGPFDAERHRQKQQQNSGAATTTNGKNSSSSSNTIGNCVSTSNPTTTTTSTPTSSPSTENPVSTTPDKNTTSTVSTKNSESASSSSSSSSSSSTLTTLTTTSSSSPPAIPSPTTTTAATSASSSSSLSSPPSSSSSSQPQSPSNDSSDGVAEGDLPSQICRLLGKVCQDLLRATGRDQHSFQMYLMLVRMVLHHDAFTAEQKKSLESQMKTAEKLWRPTPHFYRPNSGWWRGKAYPVCDSYGSRIIPRSKRDPAPDSYQQQQLHWRQQQQQQQWQYPLQQQQRPGQQQQQQQQQQQLQQHNQIYHPPHHSYHQYHQQQHGDHQSWSGGAGGSSSSSSSSSYRQGGQGGMGGHQAVTRINSWNPAYINNPGLMEPPAKQPLSKTQSAPINRPISLPTNLTAPVGGDDMEASLASLCQRVTEQALGNYEEGETSKGSGF